MFDRDTFYQALSQQYASHDIKKVAAYLDQQAATLQASYEKGDISHREYQASQLTIQNEQLSFYRSTDRFDEAIDIAAQMKATMKSLGLADTEQYAIVLLNEATTYQKKGDVESSKATYHQCEELLIRVGTLHSFTRASLYNNRAQLYLQLGEYEKSIDDGQAALTIVRVLGDMKQQEAVTLCSISVAYNRLGDYEKGEAVIDEALALYDEAGDDAHVGAVLNMKGQYLYRRHEYAKAARLFFQAAKKTEAYFGKNNEYKICMENARKAENAL